LKIDSLGFIILVLLAAVAISSFVGREYVPYIGTAIWAIYLCLSKKYGW